MATCLNCGKKLVKGGNVIYCSDSCKTMFNTRKRAKKILENPMEYINSLPEPIQRKIDCLDKIDVTRVVSRSQKVQIDLRNSSVARKLNVKDGDVIRVTIEVILRAKR